MLILVPTEIEAKPLKEAGIKVTIVGFGPVEAAINAYRILQGQKGPVFLVGLGGAYPKSGLKPGDLALANKEVFGDFGICRQNFENVFLNFPVHQVCHLNHPFVEKIAFLLEREGFTIETGTFVTVCCATRDPERGLRFALRYSAIVENMEGFAVAMAAHFLGLPLIELRVISNLIHEPERPWEIEKALNQLKEALLCLKKVF